MRQSNGYAGVKPMAAETILAKFGAYDFCAFAERVRKASALKKWRSATTLAGIFEDVTGAPAGTATGDVMWFGMALAYSGLFYHATAGRYRGRWRVLRTSELNATADGRAVASNVQQIVRNANSERSDA